MASRAHGVRSPPAPYTQSASSESPQQFRGALCQPTPDLFLRRSAALARLGLSNSKSPVATNIPGETEAEIRDLYGVEGVNEFTQVKSVLFNAG